MAKRDFYEVLGVSKTASDDEIKKAYKKMAIKYPPDRTPGDKEAEEKFKEAAEAYDVLRDPAKRSKYDQFGPDAFEPGAGGFGGAADMSMDDIFSMFGDIFGGGGFGGFGGFGGGFGGRGGQNRKPVYKGRDLRMRIELDLNDIVNGTKKKFNLKTDITCPDCKGTGSEDGKEETCSVCKGQGVVYKTRQTMLGIMQTQTVCDTCQGEGKIIKNKCKKCNGEGIVKGEKQVDIELPAGLVEGYAYNFAGKGGAGRRGGINGDLQIVVSEKPHPELVRDGLDLVYNLLLTIPQATLGTTLEVPTHDGKAKITIPAGTQPGTVLRLRGKGIPDVNGYGHHRGDEIINISVYIPEKLNKEERNAIEMLGKSENSAPSKNIKENIFSHFRAYFKK